MNKTFPTYYLEDFDEFELASSSVESLEGIEYCKHALVFDLSDNLISDLSEICDLQQIRELYLSHNELSYIDDLSNLIHLQVLDISFNQIDDLSPIMNLEELSVLYTSGNPIPHRQLKILKEKGVQIIS